MRGGEELEGHWVDALEWGGGTWTLSFFSPFLFPVNEVNDLDFLCVPTMMCCAGTGPKLCWYRPKATGLNNTLYFMMSCLAHLFVIVRRS